MFFTNRSGLSRLLLCVCFAAIPAAQAQILTDDAARRQAGKNEKDIKSITGAMQELTERLVKLEHSKQQAVILTQKNQLLEEQLRELTGKIEELQENMSTVGDSSSATDALRIELISAQNKIRALETKLTDLSQYITLPAEDELYNQAYAHYQNNNLDEAIAAFNRVLELYPEGQFGASCRYWLGKAHLTQGNYQQAQDNAQIVLDEYPSDDKTPAAILILAEAYAGMGRAEEAQLQLQLLIKQHPTSLAADSARQLLLQQ